VWTFLAAFGEQPNPKPGSVTYPRTVISFEGYGDGGTALRIIRERSQTLAADNDGPEAVRMRDRRPMPIAPPIE
jgi:hypothetical protein